MELSYAGLGLPLATAEVLALFDHYTATEPMDTLRNGWPNSSLAASSLGAQPRRWGPQIGCLHEPAGVGRHSQAWFLVDRTFVEALIEDLDSPDPDEGPDPPYSGCIASGFGTCDLYRPLVMDDGQVRIERSMRALPPKPLAGLDGAQLWLLTLVDWRYDAQEELAPIGEFTDWDTYLRALDAIRPLYNDDDELLTRIAERAAAAFQPACPMTQGARWPAAVEAACVVLGLRFADGLVDAEWSEDQIDENLSTYERYAGGIYPWHQVDDSETIGFDRRWLAAALPQSLQVAIRERGTQDWQSYSAKVQSEEIVGHGPVRLLTATGLTGECSLSDGLTDSGNPTCSLQRWTEARAADIAAWAELVYLDVKLAGVVDYLPDGVHNVAHVYRQGECYTRIWREPFHDGVELVQLSVVPDCIAPSSGDKFMWARITGRYCKGENTCTHSPSGGSLPGCACQDEDTDNVLCDPPVDPAEDPTDPRNCRYSWERVTSDYKFDDVGGDIGVNTFPPGCYTVACDALDNSNCDRNCGYVDDVPAKEVSGRTDVPVGSIVLLRLEEYPNNPTKNHYLFHSPSFNCDQPDPDSYCCQRIVQGVACDELGFVECYTYAFFPPDLCISFYATDSACIANSLCPVAHGGVGDGQCLNGNTD